MSISELVVGVLVGLPLIVLSIMFLKGRGSMLIAGYNTMPKNKREQYDAKALCKFIGKIILPIGILSLFLGVSSIYPWFPWVYGGVILGLCVFAVIYLNTGNRYKK
jgi:uncharacterized membrane protein YedE/YeeE